MTFEKSEIEPEFRELTKEEVRRAKISAFAKKRGRTRLGKFYKKRIQPWKPSNEYLEMVRQTLVEAGVPQRRFKILKYRKRVRFNIKTRGYDRVVLVLHYYYTPTHIKNFLSIYMRWPDCKPKAGRPRRDAQARQRIPQQSSKAR